MIGRHTEEVRITFVCVILLLVRLTQHNIFDHPLLSKALYLLSGDGFGYRDSINLEYGNEVWGDRHVLSLGGIHYFVCERIRHSKNQRLSLSSQFTATAPGTSDSFIIFIRQRESILNRDEGGLSYK